MLTHASLFSGIGAFEHALDRLSIKHKIVFACDIDSYVKKSYFENYKIQKKKSKKLKNTKWILFNWIITILFFGVLWAQLAHL